jgi:hypothetical protein
MVLQHVEAAVFYTARVVIRSGLGGRLCIDGFRGLESMADRALFTSGRPDLVAVAAGAECLLAGAFFRLAPAGLGLALDRHDGRLVDLLHQGFSASFQRSFLVDGAFSWLDRIFICFQFGCLGPQWRSLRAVVIIEGIAGMAGSRCAEPNYSGVVMQNTLSLLPSRSRK